MSDKWPKVPLSQVATAVIGGTPRRNVAEYWDGDIPWATAKDVASVPGRYLVQVPEFITQRGLENSAAKLLPKGTVLITARGTVGALAQLGGRMAFNQTCYALLPRDRLDNDFLFYALKGSIAEMHALTYGTVFDTITTQTLDHWAVPLPPLPDQRAIAAILGALDDKIELNRRMNQTLESMARAIFKSWFVDFDPVRSKAQGRDTALPDRIAALFPESFAESDIGQIPRGWHAAVMGDLCEIARGGAWGDDEPFDDAVEALCLRGVDLEHLRQSGWADAPRRWFKRKHIEDRKMDERDVLVAASGVGPLGRALWVSRDLESAFDLPLIYSNFCKRLRCGSVARAVYIDRWLQLMREDGEIWTYATGTSIPNLDCRSLLQGKVIVAPPDALLDSYAAFVRPIAGRLYFPESRYLAALRDGLLPKLISGELRVPDAERFLATRL